MKHKLSITILLVILFIVAQYVGLFVTKKYIKEELPYKIERPKLEPKTSFIPIFTMILIATFLAFILMKLNAIFLWQIWFFLSIIFTLSISFSTFIDQTLAFLLSIILAFYKVFRNNILIHNFTEMFIYGALAALLVPIISLFSVIILLILISIYDYIAVWKTRHMVKLAKFQSKIKIFAGLLIPYGKERAILGGGDIAFPLIFSGVALQKFGNIAFIVPLFTALSLFTLFYLAKKKKFYPAMPFITIGCFVSLLFIFIINKVYL